MHGREEKMTASYEFLVIVIIIMVYIEVVIVKLNYIIIIIAKHYCNSHIIQVMYWGTIL